VAGALQESNGHRFASFVILDRDHSSFCCTPTPVALQSYPVIEFQRQGRKKDRVFRSAVLNHRRFPQPPISSAQRRHLHGHADRWSIRKETRQLFRTVGFRLREYCIARPFHAFLRPSCPCGAPLASGSAPEAHKAPAVKCTLHTKMGSSRSSVKL